MIVVSDTTPLISLLKQLRCFSVIKNYTSRLCMEFISYKTSNFEENFPHL